MKVAWLGVQSCFVYCKHFGVREMTLLSKRHNLNKLLLVDVKYLQLLQALDLRGPEVA